MSHQGPRARRITLVGMHWSPADIADAVEAGLKAQMRADALEQAVYGFDARSELALHPVIHTGLREAGWGVWPEQRYPDDREKPKRSHGKRCDVVLTMDGLPLRDPLIKGTLFDATPAADEAEAYWLEVKTVAQYETDGPFAGYSRELLSPVAQDVKKLWMDSGIAAAGLLLVLFNESKEVAVHDLRAWHQRCIQRGFPVGAPAVRGFEIPDRIGNRWCHAAVFGVRGL